MIATSWVAFPCGYPGCDRTFTVRSNAKRHLRTHGVVPSSSVSEPPPGPYVIDFNTPTVMSSSHTPQTDKAPLKLRWMPPSLISRTNAQDLRSLSDGESDSDDASEKKTGAKWRLALPIPLQTVLPSLYDERYEERNSYLDAKPYPYHPSQVGCAAIGLFHYLFVGEVPQSPRACSLKSSFSKRCVMKALLYIRPRYFSFEKSCVLWRLNWLCT